MRAAAALAVAAPAVVMCGCGLILGVSSWQDVDCVGSCAPEASPEANDAPLDTGADVRHDAPVDSGADAHDAADASDAHDAQDAPDAIDAGPYHPLGTLANWSTFDTTTVSASAKGFAGGAFDGRYVYFAPHFDGSYDGVVTRYDTKANGGFGSGASWSTFDTTGVASGAAGYVGAVYDSQHASVYFVPDYNGAPDGIVAAYSTSGAFTQGGSWSTFDTTSLKSGASGFAGGAFDGRYLYLVPANDGAPDGVVAQYDTTQSLSTPGAWSVFDTASVASGAKGFYGAIVAGTIVLFVPNTGGSPSGHVTAYDTTQSFTTGAAWKTYDVSALSVGARGFHGGVFDGKYVYLVPYDNGSLDGVVARFDSSKAIDDQGAWAFFDVAGVAAAAVGFAGGAFDGRYVYLAPGSGKMLARYDTTAAFGGAAAWATFDVSQLGASVGPFLGAVFDGEYVYFVPSSSGVAARFDARSPAKMPQGQSGSFL